MNPMESWPQAETPKKEELPPEPAEPQALTPDRESAIQTSPEDTEKLKALEAQLGELREEMQMLHDALSKDEDLRRETDVRSAIHRSEKKFLGLFPRKAPVIPGLLSDERLKDIREATKEAERQFWELKKQRDELEEQVLDLEVLRARRKARISDAYYGTLEVSGRSVLGEEKYRAGMGQKYLELVIDEEIEALKKKRGSN